MSCVSVTNLICDGSEFPVPRKYLTDLRLFKDDPGRLGSPYNVRCGVSAETCRVFVSSIMGKPVSITNDNCEEVARLSGEFGYSGLDKTIERFRGKYATVEDDDDSQNPLERILRTELDVLKRQLCVIKDLVTAPTRYVKLAEDVAIMKQMLTTLMSDMTQQKQKIADLVGLGTDKREDAGRQLCDEIKYRGQPFVGILDYFRSKWGGNIRDTCNIDITASSTHLAGHPYIVAVRDHPHGWHSAERPNSFITFDFREYRVCPTHYTLRRWKDHTHFPMKWRFSGSNDENDWTIVDDRETRELCQNDPRSFPCKLNLPWFRYLRFEQTGVNAMDHHWFLIGEVEFFGKVKSL